MYILKSSIIHLFSYMNLEELQGRIQGWGKRVRPLLGTKIFFLFNFQNTRKINKIESGPPFLKILDPPLTLAVLTTAYIAQTPSKL